MPIYKFEAMDTAGNEVKDSIDALSEEDARQKIKQLGYFVTKITEVADTSSAAKAILAKYLRRPRTRRTRLIDKLLTTVIGPFRPLIRFFKKPVAKSPPKAGEAKPAPEEKAGGKKPMPESAPVRHAPSGEKDIFETDFEVPALDESGSAQAAHSGSRKIGEVLIELGYLDEDQLWEVLDEAKKTGNLTGQVAVARGLITEDQLLAALADQHNLKFISLDDVTPTAEALQVVPETMALDYMILPLSYRDGILTVVSSDPSNLAALEALRNYLGCKEVRAHIASPKAIANAQVRAYEESIIDIINSLEADPDVPRQSESSIDLTSLMEIQDADPVRKLVNMVFLLAIKDHASDIHFEPFEDEFKMRYRCDGTLYEMVPPPRHLAMEITDRIKVMANLDIAERRRPQHGRVDLNVGGNPVPMRVSVLPTMFGENVAIRVLDWTAVGLDLNRVGMDPALLAQFREIIHKPNGIVLVTGPTGAGKTTTLYSALNELNEITDKIITAEDPVEYDIDGIVRCQRSEEHTS